MFCTMLSDVSDVSDTGSNTPRPFEYWTISTTADDENSNTGGGIGGRMMKREDPRQIQPRKKRTFDQHY